MSRVLESGDLWSAAEMSAVKRRCLRGSSRSSWGMMSKDRETREAHKYIFPRHIRENTTRQSPFEVVEAGGGQMEGGGRGRGLGGSEGGAKSGPGWKFASAVTAG